MVDLSLIKSLLSRENYQRYRNYLKDTDFTTESRLILKNIDLWYQDHSTDPSLEDIVNLTFSSSPVSEPELIKELFSRLDSLEGTETVPALLESFKRRQLLEQASLAAYNAANGRAGLAELHKLIKQLEEPSLVEKVEYVTDDINEILSDTVKKPGLRWRLQSLNRSLGSIRKGDFGIMLARVETGKTTMLTSEATFMASQLTETSGPILWFNNEEQGKKVKLRLYQAALGKTLPQLLSNPQKAAEDYKRVTKGKINLFDSAEIHRNVVESLCQKESPSLVVFDQIDKIKGFKGDRRDLEMGEIYRWAREIAKTYCPVIAVCQADGTAVGESWLHAGHMADSKTAKPAEADFILGIGKNEDTGFEFVRYLNISKNKLTGDQDTDPALRHARIETMIEPDIARYRDL